jgi:hypothetical protein
LGARLWKHVLWFCMAAEEAGLLEIRIHRLHPVGG